MNHQQSTNDQFKDFLIYVAKHGYANDASTKVREADGSDTISSRRGDWRFHDNYFTSESGRRFYGREVIFYQDRPYWFLGYSGYVMKDNDPGGIYRFLKVALAQPDLETPVRGPRTLEDGALKYRLDMPAELNAVHGSEFISRDGKDVYMCVFNGGMIDGE